MIIGVPKEIKPDENRVGIAPVGVRELTSRGHRVVVESTAGCGIQHGDDDYRRAGAEILPGAEEVFAAAELIVKVKEPQPEEYARLRPGQILFTYLHLAPDPDQARGLMESGCIAIAYETVTDDRGGLPLLTPMSEVAGRMAVVVGAYNLLQVNGGRGVLASGVPGVAPGKVTILGGGVAGGNAMMMAMGLGSEVVVIDRDMRRLAEIDTLYGSRIKTVYSTRETVERHVADADLLIGTVLIRGAAAPKLVTREMVRGMKAGAVIVDVAVDQGGCCETTRPTTHQDPTYIVDEVVHYCVTNMPGGVARTSTYALNNVTLPFIKELAQKGAVQAMQENPHLLNGLNVCRGRITYRAVAEDLGLEYTPPLEALGEE